jgi:hypothetical protein
MNPQETAAQQIALVGHVEEICEHQGLVPPVEVNIVDASGSQYDIEYCPESDWVDLPPVPIMPPVVLDFTDATGRRMERRLSDFAPSPEWTKRSLQ